MSDLDELRSQRDEAIRLLEYKAEAQKLLVECLVSLRDGTWHPKDDKHHSLQKFIDSALAKVKKPRNHNHKPL